MSSSNGAGPSHISQASLLELKAITAEHVDRFSKEGKKAIKGAPRQRGLEKSRDPFDRPSPGLVRRLAAEAKNDAKRRRFDNEEGPNEEQRQEILKAKAKKYAAMRRGDLSGLSGKELEEAVIDFERKLEEDRYSSHSSDEDESARPARWRWDSHDESEDDDDLAKVEYVDEMGRTRTGTRKEAKEAERLKGGHSDTPIEAEAENTAYAEVLQSRVIHGDQNFFPIYEPDADAIKAKYRAAEEEARAHHYDSTKEVRVKGAGQYQFSLDEAARAEQMASLAAERKQTESARAQAPSSVHTDGKGGSSQKPLSAAQIAKQRKLEERKALIEAQRAKRLGGKEEVERLKEVKKAKEAEDFLNSLESEMGQK